MARTHGLSAYSEALVAPTGSEALRELVAGQIAAACNWRDDQRDGLLQAIHQRFGAGVQAILIYGSYLRGKRDTLLDFYVLLEDYAAMQSPWQAALAWMLPPNVFQVRCGSPPAEARAKCALMTLGRFEYALKYEFHSYFWGRFAQPSGLLYCRDEAVRDRLAAAISQAASTFVQRVVPRLPDRFSAAELVGLGLSLTYQCELRSEPPDHAETLYGHYVAYYQAMVAALASAGLGYRSRGETDSYRNETGPGSKHWAVFSWCLRRLQGKLLSLLRLLKAILTFSGGFDYLLWKIARYSELSIEPTPKQRKYPLIFAWPLLWRLYRRGAFR
jgi:hypothetical protein